MDDCVLGSRIGRNGYARVPSGKRGSYLYAHRVAWERVNGLIPKGAHLHHVCQVKACVNVAHMELKASFREHMREHPPLRQCDHVDRYMDSRGKSVCRTCRRERERERYRADLDFRLLKIARATAFKQRKRKEVLHERSQRRLVDA